MGYVKAADGEYWPLFYTMILDGLLLKLACSGLLVRPIGISFGYKLTKSTRDVTVRVGHLLKPVSQCHWQPFKNLNVWRPAVTRTPPSCLQKAS